MAKEKPETKAGSGNSVTLINLEKNSLPNSSTSPNLYGRGCFFRAPNRILVNSRDDAIPNFLFKFFIRNPEAVRTSPLETLIP